ncbi:MAG: endonuclease/exonuclease/phosphatase family [Hyperionvirus sp.]|uniref:Endonuclease/exonuclease/phosphatase family n=1 Tax=Hyperionvirus sp. TaxID=2487770 RepID=A0A3G5AFW8_9VIRU|nr:MAG: endonuclease/exonuclease/phosphatase family [Hyperionvirus sp.]
MTSKFPTSEALFSRIKTDTNLVGSHVSIVYLDSMKEKYLEKNISTWKNIADGGDIPWHRVHYFKYKDKVIWDRALKKCDLTPIMKASSLIANSFKVVTYNVLSDFYLKEITDFSKRKDVIVKYLMEAGADVICLQEVTDLLLDELKGVESYQIAFTDRKGNNVVIMTKCKIVSVRYVTFNESKQAICVGVESEWGVVQFVGVHLTSSMSPNSAVKRREQISMIIYGEIDMMLPTVLLGDFNIELESDMGDNLVLFEDVGDKKVCTYDPVNNSLAFAISRDKTPKRLDRVYVNSFFGVVGYKVREDVKFSDHYPVECILALRGDAKDEKVVLGPGVANKRTGVIVIVDDDRVDKIRRKLDPTFKKWMSHVTVFYGFGDPDMFDVEYYKVKELVETKYLGKRLRFSEVGVLEHEESMTVCLFPDVESREILVGLRNDIMGALKMDRSQGFNPHLTLGKIEKGSEKKIDLEVDMELSAIHFVTLGESFIEVKRAIHRVKLSASSIVETIGRVLEKKVMVGGSGIFSGGTDLDLVIFDNGAPEIDKKTILRDMRRKLIFSGIFRSVIEIENLHSIYLKLKTITNVPVDLHLCRKGIDESYDKMGRADQISASTYFASVYIKNVVGGRYDDFCVSLNVVKDLLKKCEVYSQVYGYLGGISIAVMMVCLYGDGTVCAGNVVAKFCEKYGKWGYPEAIFLEKRGSGKGDKVAGLMQVCNVLAPYENTVRNITKSTLAAWLNVIQNKFVSTLEFGYVLIFGVKANNLDIFEAMMQFVDSNVVKLIVGFEANGCGVKPTCKWNIRVQQGEEYMFEGSWKMYLVNNNSTAKIEQLEKTMRRLFPNQIFKKIEKAV